ncbi:unnamed protein product [Porites evermanni]|uniref:Uncharacterized protein n=1 Tax=Porites evermanni TaxID=104178 RepID=A0ABN8S0U9_9CNID|nr:unnamed protein product [Porites evermanni]
MLHIFEPILEEPSEQTQEEGKENPILIHGACGTLTDEKQDDGHKQDGKRNHWRKKEEGKKLKTKAQGDTSPGDYENAYP